jgi:predicted metal-dependent hydrolase
MFFRRAKPAQPKQRTVNVAGRALPLTIRSDRRATRLTLRIEPGGRALRMTVPPGVPFGDVEDFLARHHGWLASRLANIPADASLAEGRTIMLRGVEHRIVATGKLRGLTERTMIDGAPVLLVSGEPQHVGRRLSDFLKKEARNDLEELARFHARVSGRRIASISLKDTKSRWGSCTHDGNLSFSWRIVMAPPHVIDYLAAHEVAHLTEMNHGPRFWALCEKLCPGTREAKAWLKRHGSALHAVDFS